MTGCEHMQSLIESISTTGEYDLQQIKRTKKIYCEGCDGTGENCRIIAATDEHGVLPRVNGKPVNERTINL